MKITKKELLLRLQENLNEMPIKYDSEDRPSSDIERDLSTRETPFKKVNLPKNVDEPYSNFEELLASKRYQEIVNNIRQYTGLPRLSPDQRTIGTLMNTMGMAQQRVQQIESRHKSQLEALAVELVMNEMGVEEGDIVYDAKIERPNSDGFEETSPEDMEPEEIELEKELYDELEDLTLERAKRRLINAMMAGSSSKGHYMFHYATDKLIEITGDRNIIGLYGSLMSSAEAMLWQMGNQDLGLGGGGGAPQAGGKETVFPNETPPRVVARAINFPILVHELMKGTLEVVAALHGQPKDKEMASKVIELEDTLQKEIWDLRLGPAIWGMLRDSFPEEVITDEDKSGMQLVLFQTIVSKPAKQFLVFMKEVLSGTQSGKQLMGMLYNIINSEINDYDYKLAMQKFDEDLNKRSNEIDSDEFKDFLGDLGISLSDD
jgi:hypothetical protein